MVRLHNAFTPHADGLALARIARAREDAARQLGKTRDLTRWRAAMNRPDNEERIARDPADGHRLAPAEIVDHARSLPRLWADAGTNGCQALVQSLSARLDVLGYRQLDYELTTDALDLGLDAALPATIELDSKVGEFGRGERI